MLALALDLRFAVGEHPFSIPSSIAPDDRAAAALDERHPAAVAYRAAGGTAPIIYGGGPIPPGRGLGFSAAARVAGAACALAQTQASVELNRAEAFEIAAELEGHADNAAAAAFGGAVLVTPTGVLPIHFDRALQTLIWIPPTESSTARSRAQLPTSFSVAQTTAGIARTAALVLALCGDHSAFPHALGDELHEPVRFRSLQESAAMFEQLRQRGAPYVYLSGSGPSVAALGTDSELDDLLHRFVPATGSLKLFRIESEGLTPH